LRKILSSLPPPHTHTHTPSPHTHISLLSSEISFLTYVNIIFNGKKVSKTHILKILRQGKTKIFKRKKETWVKGKRIFQTLMCYIRPNFFEKRNIRPKLDHPSSKTDFFSNI
jgi:hypothetical protein